MLRDRLTKGVPVGLLAAAATTGALLAFGLRRGEPARAFAELVSSRAADAPLAVALAGAGAQAFMALAIGVAFASLAARLRGVRLLAAAAVAGCLAFVLNSAILPAPVPDGGARVLDSAHLAALHLLLALVLAVGMRLALRGGGLGQVGV